MVKFEKRGEDGRVLSGTKSATAMARVRMSTHNSHHLRKVAELFNPPLFTSRSAPPRFWAAVTTISRHQLLTMITWNVWPVALSENSSFVSQDIQKMTNIFTLYQRNNLARQSVLRSPPLPSYCNNGDRHCQANKSIVINSCFSDQIDEWVKYIILLCANNDIKHRQCSHITPSTLRMAQPSTPLSKMTFISDSPKEGKQEHQPLPPPIPSIQHHPC